LQSVFGNYSFTIHFATIANTQNISKSRHTRFVGRPAISTQKPQSAMLENKKTGNILKTITTRDFFACGNTIFCPAPAFSGQG